MVCTPPTHREAGSLFKLLTAVAAQLKHHVGKKPRDSPQNPWQWRDCTLLKSLESVAQPLFKEIPSSLSIATEVMRRDYQLLSLRSQ